MKKWAAKKETPTELCRLGYGIDIQDDEWGGDTDVVVDNHEFYSVQWAGTPGVSDFTIARKSNSEIEQIKKSIAAQIVIARIIEHEDEKDLEPFLFKGQLFKVTEAVEKTIKRCENSGMLDIDPLPCNDGKWDNYNGAFSVDFTVGDLKDLYNQVYDRSAANYVNMKNHASLVMAMINNETKTEQDVFDYDYSAGWNEE